MVLLCRLSQYALANYYNLSGMQYYLGISDGAVLTTNVWPQDSRLTWCDMCVFVFIPPEN